MIFIEQVLNKINFPFTVRPFFVRLPGDVVGVTGDDATLSCRAGGSPRPHVLWRRHDGRMPVARAKLDEENHSLRITGLKTQDAGVYICQAENDVATVVANATLTVHGKIKLFFNMKTISNLTVFKII